MLSSAADITWTGGNGDWFAPSNWNPATVPGTQDKAIITSGSPVVNENTSVGGLEISQGGGLDGSGNLNVIASFLWTGGFIQGSGAITIGSTATMTIDGDATKSLSVRSLNIQGTLIWRGNGTWVGRDSAVINNSGMIEMHTIAPMTRFNQQAILNNSGSIKRTGETGIKSMEVDINNTGTFITEAGSTSLEAAFHNSGNLFIKSASLILNGTGTHSGAATIESTANLIFERGLHALSQGASFTGVGIMHLNANATLQVNGIVNAQNFAFHAGTLKGAGTFTVQSKMEWEGGSMEENGATTIGEGALMIMKGSAVKSLSSRTLNNSGMIIWHDGIFVGRDSAVINNQSTGIFEWKNDATMDRFNQAAGCMTKFFVKLPKAAHHSGQHGYLSDISKSRPVGGCC